MHRRAALIEINTPANAIQSFHTPADMATKSSREAALERRKALTDGGKKASAVTAGGGRSQCSRCPADPDQRRSEQCSPPGRC